MPHRRKLAEPSSIAAEPPPGDGSLPPADVYVRGPLELSVRIRKDFLCPFSHRNIRMGDNGCSLWAAAGTAAIMNQAPTSG